MTIFNLKKTHLFISGNSIFTAICISVLIIGFTWNNLPFFEADSHWYISLAEGASQNVIKPFSTRILQPYTVGGLSILINIDLNTSFLIVGVITLIILVLTSTLLLKLISHSSLVVFSFLFTPFLFSLFKDYFVPDLFFAALLGVFFFLLSRNWIWQSLPILFLLALTRESFLVLAICLVIFFLFKKKHYPYIISVILVSFAGIGITSLAGNQGQPNLHNASQFVYLGLKIPFNILSNFFGIQLWSNTLALQSNSGFIHPPLMTFQVPAWLHLGSITSVGIYGFNILKPLNMLSAFFTLFGLAPGIYILTFMKTRLKHFQNLPLWLAIAILYGLLSFILGTMTGASVDRLMSYGWPAFLFGVPYLLNKLFVAEKKSFYLLLIFQVVISWLPVILKVIPNAIFSLLGVIVISVFLYGIVLWKQLMPIYYQSK